MTVRSGTSGLGAVLLAVALVTAGCGGSSTGRTDASASEPSASVSITPQPTPTAASTPTPSTEPLSRFEDQPSVQALRRWAAAAAHDVNAGRHDFPTARRFVADTAQARSNAAATWRQDFGTYYPGPLPFTPVAVSTSGADSRVSACAIGSGFALKKEGGRPSGKHEVIPVVFTMTKQRGDWVLVGVAQGTAACGGVAIKEVPW